VPTIRSISTAIALALLAPLTVMATEASAAATSANAWWTTHQPRSPLALNIAPARSTPDWWQMSRPPAGDLGLRASLSDAFTSIELGAPPSVPVGANPSGIAVNEATHTVYVVDDGDDTVSVIDADACNALRPSGCGQPVATIPLGPSGTSGPVAAILSPDGRTLYVTSPDGANSVAVLDAATCNATNTSGCADGPVASVATGNGPLDVAEDPLGQTLYVTNFADDTVSVIDGQLCNAQHTAGCGETAPTVSVGTAPVAVAVDVETQTVYVGNLDDDTVSVIDAGRCNAEHPAGCRDTPPVQAVGGGPDAIAVSRHGRTVYVANSGITDQGVSVVGGNTVSVIDARICDAAHPQGCSAVPAPVVAVGAGQGNQPQAVAVDPLTHNVYVTDDNDDTLSVIDGARCGWHDASDCALPAPTVQTGADPSAVAVDPSVHTIYVLDAADNAVAVIAAHACTNSDPMGCRPAPAVAAPLAPYHELSSAAVDPAQHTAYVIDSGVNGAGPSTLDLIDTSKCNAGDRAGCDPHPALATVTLPSSPSDVALDPRTNTLYVSEGNPGPDQLEVIAAASCNATITSCAKTATIPFADGSVPQDLVVDSATHTVYVGFPDNIAVIDTRHCNAETMTGCATQAPATIPVPFGGMAVGPDTLYVTGIENPATPGWVSVIDTQHCQAADTSRCASQSPPEVPVGLFPEDAAVDLDHHTLYVIDNAFGNSTGMLSMIDTTHCNGDDTSDCANQTPGAIPMRRAPFRETFDPATSTLYVTNFANASVSLINTATCNATMHAGCRPVPPQVVVGSGPWSPVLDPGTRTLYVPDFWDGTVSIVGTGQ